MAKLCCLLKVHFVFPVLFVLTLACDRAALYGNATFLLVTPSTKIQYFSLLKSFPLSEYF